jgi:hypothetical protein
MWCRDRFADRSWHRIRCNDGCRRDHDWRWIAAAACDDHDHERESPDHDPHRYKVRRANQRNILQLVLNARAARRIARDVQASVNAEIAGAAGQPLAGYRRRTPERTMLVARHAQTMFAELREADPEGGGLPRHVERELAAY